MNAPAIAERTDLSEVMLDGPLKNMAQAWAIARVLAQSSMVPHALRGSPQNCLVTMMLGQELGLTWTQATRGIYVLPNGTPGLRGQLLLSLIRRAGHRYTFDRADDSCTCTITRKDEDFKVPYEGRFDVEDAKAAGLVTVKDGKLFARSHDGKPLPWEQYRRDMLQWRAVARAAGIGAPEVIYGFDIAGIGDGSEGSVAPAPAPAVQVAAVEADDGQAAKDKLAELDQQMRQNQEWVSDSDYDATAEEPPAPPLHSVESARVPPGHDDLDKLLNRSGYHGDAQADIVSALVHRDVNGITDLTQSEVMIAHDVVTRAIKGLSTIGARRAALAQLAAAEIDAMAEADEQSWQDE